MITGGRVCEIALAHHTHTKTHFPILVQAFVHFLAKAIFTKLNFPTGKMQLFLKKKSSLLKFIKKFCKNKRGMKAQKDNGKSMEPFSVFLYRVFKPVK